MEVGLESVADPGVPGDFASPMGMSASLVLAARTPMMLCWGREKTQLPNEALSEILKAAQDEWALLWSALEPSIDAILAGGAAIELSDRALTLSRNEGREEAYYTFSLSGVRDERGGVGGVLVACTETTQRVRVERRMRCLRELAERTARARSAEDVLQQTVAALESSSKEVPFALAYLFGSGADRVRLVASFGAPESVTGDTSWLIGQVSPSISAILLEDARFGTALIHPLTEPGREHSTGVLIAGISPWRTLDDEYRGFFEIAAAQTSTALANARALEAEKKRSEALAAIDRVKTAFFGNISHEFRTPLTLMVRPLEDVLDDPEHSLPSQHRDRLETVHRNAMRLLKLVNTLLDFSRIEAGRVETSFEATDLATLTRDVASIFASAMKRAGLSYNVDCPPLGDETYVDREMWEKIVLNLISNAFKFTFRGGVTVSMKKGDRSVTLSVKDTGVGIPKDEQQRVFERFHRVRGVRARTQEGTGIGLSLVRELARLHGGSVTLASAVGIGTELIVELPLGRGHLPSDRIGARKTDSNGCGALPYLEEATRWAARVDDSHTSSSELPAISDTSWLSERSQQFVVEPELRAEMPRVMVAEDNDDMRSYLERLLSRFWKVEAFSDSEAAFARAKEYPPDLVISDVMLPEDGAFDLLRELRAHALTCGVPVLVLSARAGEESRVEGFEAGADDYLVKPFSTRELTARVRSLLEMARVRKDLAQKERAARAEAEESRRFLSALIGNLPGTAYRGRNDSARSMDFVSAGIVELTGYLPDELSSGAVKFADLIVHEDKKRVIFELAKAVEEKRSFQLVYRLNKRGGAVRWVREQGRASEGSDVLEGFITDITELKITEARLREQSDTISLIQEVGLVLARELELEALIDTLTGAATELTGADSARFVDVTALSDEKFAAQLKNDRAAFSLDAAAGIGSMWCALISRTGELLGAIVVSSSSQSRFGEREELLLRGLAAQASIALDNARLYRTLQEREERFRANAESAESANRMKDEFLATLSHEIRTPLNAMMGWSQLLSGEKLDDSSFNRAVRSIERNTKVLSQLVQELLDVSRIVAGKLRLDVKPINVSRVISSAVDTVRASAESKKIALAVELSCTNDVVSGDAGRLQQVLLNLLTNAIKFTPAGGHISVRAAELDHHLVIRVSDDGKGIDPQFLPHIFERFRQADSSSTRSHGGLGIGLAIAQHLVALHGGTIRAESDGKNSGATFIIELPLVRGPEAIAPDSVSAKAQGRPQLGGLRVLIVDDEPDARELLTAVLEQFGASVSAVGSAPEALEALQVVRPNMLVSDIGMPEHDGYWLIRSIRALDPSHGGLIPAVALTAYAAEQDRERALAAGFHRHVTKPIDAQELINTLLKLAGDEARAS